LCWSVDHSPHIHVAADSSTVGAVGYLLFATTSLVQSYSPPQKATARSLYGTAAADVYVLYLNRLQRDRLTNGVTISSAAAFYTGTSAGPSLQSVAHSILLLLLLLLTL